jgi:hypothetical protein
MSDHVARNRAAWDERAGRYAEEGRRNWAGEPMWGIWRVPEADVGFLGGDVAGRDVIELWHAQRRLDAAG